VRIRPSSRPREPWRSGARCSSENAARGGGGPAQGGRDKAGAPARPLTTLSSGHQPAGGGLSLLARCQDVGAPSSISGTRNARGRGGLKSLGQSAENIGMVEPWADARRIVPGPCHGSGPPPVRHNWCPPHRVPACRMYGRTILTTARAVIAAELPGKPHSGFASLGGDDIRRRITRKNDGLAHSFCKSFARRGTPMPQGPARNSRAAKLGLSGRRSRTGGPSVVPSQSRIRHKHPRPPGRLLQAWNSLTRILACAHTRSRPPPRADRGARGFVPIPKRKVRRRDWPGLVIGRGPAATAECVPCPTTSPVNRMGKNHSKKAGFKRGDRARPGLRASQARRRRGTRASLGGGRPEKARTRGSYFGCADKAAGGGTRSSFDQGPRLTLFVVRTAWGRPRDWAGWDPFELRRWKVLDVNTHRGLLRPITGFAVRVTRQPLARCDDFWRADYQAVFRCGTLGWNGRGRVHRSCLGRRRRLSRCRTSYEDPHVQKGGTLGTQVADAFLLPFQRGFVGGHVAPRPGSNYQPR